MNEEQRAAICSAAVQLMAHVGYVNAGTVEFLVEGDQFYFIEVNPRVQVEHTITEMITDIDIVISQLQMRKGLICIKYAFAKTKRIDIKRRGYSMSDYD